MDIQDIKKQIDELLLLNEGKELILEGARNFRYIACTFQPPWEGS